MTAGSVGAVAGVIGPARCREDEFPAENVPGVVELEAAIVGSGCGEIVEEADGPDGIPAANSRA